MKKIILGIMLFLAIAAMSLVSYRGASAFKADCCNDGSKCCTQSCCEEHK